MVPFIDAIGAGAASSPAMVSARCLPTRELVDLARPWAGQRRANERSRQNHWWRRDRVRLRVQQSRRGRAVIVARCGPPR